MDYLLSHKKNEIPTPATKWMELYNIMLCGMRQTQKDKYHRFSLICAI